MKRELNERELATVLAALRIFQRDPDPTMEHFDEVEPLSADEIDELCEELNTE
jgi:hypothetical protein